MTEGSARPTRRTARVTGALALLLALSSCGAESTRNRPMFPFLSNWQKGKEAAPVLLTNEAWWRGLRDARLNSLVDRAMAGNLSIAIARERITGAAAELRAVPGVVDSTVSLAANAGDGTASGTASYVNGSVGLTWLLDPWGGRKAEARSAEARLEGARAERDAAQLLVLSELSDAYLELRLRQALYQQSLGDLKRRQELREITRSLDEANAATRVETTRSEARLAEIEAALPAERAAIEAKKNEIAVLAGASPGQLGIDLGAAGQPVARLSPNMGIPADLLRNRPDVRIAEQFYYAALADMDATQAAQYPALSLTGSIDLSHARRGQTGGQYVFGPQLVFPTAREADVEARASDARAAYLQWTQTVSDAVLEVENALADYRAISGSLRSAEQAVKLYRETRALTDEVFRAGDTTLSELIDTDTDVSRAERALAEARYQQAASFVALNVALGAGHGAAVSPGL